MQFRAAVLHRVNAPLSIETVEITGLKPTDVLVRMRASGLCHTDLEVIQGQLAYPLPIVLGHEGAGVVEAVGSEVTLVRPGDHVVCSWNPSCGHCYYCDRGQPILCEPFSRHQPQGHLLDGTSRMTVGGQKLHHFSVVSSHAEYCVVPETGAVPVPKEIPFDRACLIGCGVMTGVGGAARIARIPAGSTVAVLGCGAVGLNAIQGARLQEAERIIAIDRDPERLAMATEFGATHLVRAGEEDVVARVKELTQGRGADCVLESAGHVDAYRLSSEITRSGGDLVWLGKVNVDRDVAFRWGSLMGEKRITRSSYGGARPRRDFPWLARLYLAGKLKLDELITMRIGLDEINVGFAAMIRGEAVRTVIEFPQ
ncbi:Zn-dependent alcohol dehydrogenase [Stella sp.]|uniref:Zn-dependent alcohol dehydrogenase n=1 Tax=Stella sp. TaxID=2912054 RepID=UPI0035AF51EB